MVAIAAIWTDRKKGKEEQYQEKVKREEEEEKEADQGWRRARPDKNTLKKYLLPKNLESFLDNCTVQ